MEYKWVQFKNGQRAERATFLTVARYILALLASIIVSTLLYASSAFAAAPTVSTVSPKSAFNGAGDTVVISGSGFDETTTVLFDKIPASITGRADTSLSVTVPVSTVVGPVVVQVQNGDGTVLSDFVYIGSGPTGISLAPNQGPLSGGTEVTATTNSSYYYGLNFDTVSAGYDHSCGISRGKAYCWGANASGQLGNGTGISSLLPVAVDTSGVLSGKVITQVVAGSSATTVLTADNMLFSWGSGGSGRLGSGSSTSTQTPVPVVMNGALAGKTIKKLVAGANGTSAVVTSDNALYTWGFNGNGQLGIGNTTTSTVPVAVTGGALNGKSVADVAVGASHVLAIDTEGLVYSWGSNASGQLGDNSTTQRTLPVAVYSAGVLNGKKIVSVASGNAYSLALDETGRAYGWGLNTSGQLGDNSTTQRNIPVGVFNTGALSGKTITKLVTGGSHALAQTSDGLLYSWGTNVFGQLGDATNAQRNAPVLVATGELGSKTVTDITAQNYSSMVRTSDGLLFGWGYNASGQLAHTTTISRNTPTASTVQSPLPYTMKLGGVTLTSLSLDQTTLSFDTLPHEQGPVDFEFTSAYTQPVTIANAFRYNSAPTVSQVAPTTISVASGDTLVISGTGFIEGAQVRVGASSYAPATFINSTTLQVTAPILFESGKASIWVRNPDGQVGQLVMGLQINQTMTVNSVSPARGPVAGGQTVTIQGGGFTNGIRFTKVEASHFDHSCGISGGKVYCWGLNNSGQVGDGTTVNRLTPTPVDVSGVMAGKDIVDISLGTYFSVALASDGTVFAWGANSNGQLGNGTVTASSTPVQVKNTGVLAGKKLVDIETAPSGVIALDDLGHGYGWGYNAFGQLGNGSTNTAASDPVAMSMTGVLAGKRLISVSTGARASGAIADDGNAYTWGFGAGGSLGNGTTTTTQLTPVAVTTSGVLAGKKLVKISMNALNTDSVIALDSKGAVYAWGDGSKGQLGNGTTTATATTPVAVRTSAGGLLNKRVVDIDAGMYHMYALDSEGKVYAWGNNDVGQLGNGNTTQQTSPVPVNYTGPMAGKVIRSISGGGNNGLFVDTEGLAYGIGSDSNGKLGSGSVATVRLNPVSTITSIASPVDVELGGMLITPTSQTDTAVSFVTQPHAEGAVDLRVTSRQNSSFSTTLQNAYTFVNGPQISAVTPNYGTTAGGNQVYISGENFNETTTVSFGTIAAQSTLVNSNTLRVTVPANVTPGIVSVKVMGEFNQEQVLTDGYMYQLQAPVLTSISPQASKQSGGGIVTITGSGFVQRQGGGTWYEVLVDGQPASNVTYVNATTLRFTAPAHAPGAVNVTVGGQYSESATLTGALRYLPEAYSLTTETQEIMATQPGLFTVTLRDGNGDPITTSTDLTLSLNTSTSTGFFARALSGQNAGWDYDSVVIPAGQSSANFYYRDSASGAVTISVSDTLGTTASQNVTVLSKYKLLVTGVSNPTNAGVPSSVTVQAVDYSGRPQSDYRGTISFSSNDGAAILPGDYTFQASDNGRKTFINGVTFGSAGTWTVEATDTGVASITGAQLNVSVGPPASGSIAKLNFITPAQSFALDQTSGVITIQTQDVDGVPTPVGSTTQVYLRSSSSTGSFSIDGGASWIQSPALVTIAGGTSSLNALYRDTTAGQHTLKVSQQPDTDFGWAVGTQPVTVGVGAPAKLKLSTPSNTPIGVWTPVDVVLTDLSANPVSSPSDTPVRVTVGSNGALSEGADGSNETGEVTVYITAGTQSITLWVRATTGAELTLTATDERTVDESTKYEQANATVLLGDAEASGLVFSALPQKVAVYEAAPLSVSLRDQFGNIIVAEEDTEVTLTSASADAAFSAVSAGPWQASLTATIDAGAATTQVFFRHTTTQPSVVLTATSDGLGDATGSIEVAPGLYAGKVRFSLNSTTSIRAGDDQPFTVELLDAYGNPTAATETVEIGFGSVQPVRSTWDGTDAINPINPGEGETVTVQAGQGSAQAVFRSELAGTKTLKAYDQARWQRSCIEYEYTNGPCRQYSAWSNTSMGELTLAISPRQPVAVTVTSQPQVVIKNTPSLPITVELRDEFDNAAYFAETTNVTVASSSDTGGFSQVLDGEYTDQSISFAAGSAVATVYYRDSSASSSQGDVLTFSRAGLTQATQSIRIIEGIASKVVLDTDGETTVAAGQIVPVTLRTTTEDGLDVIVLQDTQFTLTGGEGEFSRTETPFVPVSNVTLAANTGSTGLFYRSFNTGRAVLSASSASISASPTELAVTGAAVYRLGYTTVPTNNRVQAAQPSDAFVVTSFDEYGNVTSPNNNDETPVSLQTNSEFGVFSETTTGPWNVTRVTIPAGATSTGSYYYKAGSLNDQTGALTNAAVLGDHQLIASTPAVLAAQTTIRVVGTIAERISFLTGEQSLVAGAVSTPITVQLQTISGEAAITTADQTVSLTSLELDGDGDFAGIHGADVFSLTPGGDPVTTVTVPAGASRATFYVMSQTAENHRIRASSAVTDYDGGYIRTISTTQNVSVAAGAAAKLIFEGAEQTIFPDAYSAAIKISLTDMFGNKASNQADRTIQLASGCETGEFFTQIGGEAVGTLTMPSSEDVAFFYYRDSAAGSQPCTLTVSSDALETATHDIVIREAVYALGVTSDPQTVDAGQTSGAIIVHTYDRFGNIAATDRPQTITVTANSSDYTVTPQQQTIPTGSSEASFTFRQNAAVQSQTPVVITVSDQAGKLLSTTHTITVNPGIATRTVFDADTFNAAVGEYHPLKVELRNAYGVATKAHTDLSMSLSSTGLSGAFYKQTAPNNYETISSVEVAEGQLQSSVIYYRQTTTTQTQAGDNTPVNLTASANGLQATATRATIEPLRLSFSTGDFTAVTSSYTAMRVHISSPIVGDLEVTLSSTDTNGRYSSEENETRTITSVTIPAGQTQSQEFYYRQTTPASAESPETLTATAVSPPLSIWNASSAARFYNGGFSTFVVVAAPSSLEQGQSGTITLEARDEAGNVTAFTNSSSGYCLYVRSSGQGVTVQNRHNVGSGCISAQDYTAVWVPQNATRTSLTVSGSVVGSQQLKVSTSSGSGGIEVEEELTITAAQTTKLGFAASRYSVIRGGEASVAIRLLSDHNFVVNSRGQLAVSLTSNSVTGRFYDETTHEWTSVLTTTIQAGQTELTGIRFSDTTTANEVTLRATADGLSAGEAKVTVGTGSFNALGFSTAPPQLELQQDGTFTIQLQDDQGNGVVAAENTCVYLTSSDASIVLSNRTQVTGCVDSVLPNGEAVYALNVPASQSSVSFSAHFKTLGDATMRASTVRGGGGISAAHTVSVVAGAPASVAFSTSAYTAVRGGLSEGEVQVRNAYGATIQTPRDLQVTLTSSYVDGQFAVTGSGPWQDSLTLTIPAGASSSQYVYLSGDIFLGDISLTATTDDELVSGGSSVLTIAPGEVTQLAFASTERTTTATHPSSVMTLRALNQYGIETAVSSDTTLYVRTSSETGEFATSPAGPWNISSVKMPAGESIVNFHYRDETVGTHTISVRDKLSPQEGESFLSAAQEHHVVKQVFHHFIVTNISSPQRAGTASSIVVFAVDSENYIVADYDGTVSLSSDDPTAFITPLTYTFNPATDKGIHTFTNAVAFRTAGEKTVTITDQSGLQGAQSGIEVTNGNAAPVRALSFIAPAEDRRALTSSLASDTITVQLNDTSGAPTNAPSGGVPLRVTSNSPTGLFSVDMQTWSEDIVVMVDEGMSFSTTPLYFKDSTGGAHTVTVTDWNGSVDSTAITNADLTFTVRQMSLSATTVIESRSMDGVFIENPYLFSHDEKGTIVGRANVKAQTSSIPTGDVLISNWNIRVGQFNAVINQKEQLLYQTPLLTPAVGDDDYTLQLTATSGDLTSTEAVKIPVSSWRVGVGPIAVDDSLLVGSLETTQNNTPEESTQVIVRLIGGVNQIIRTWSLSDLLAGGLAQMTSDGEYAFRVPLRLFAGGSYVVAAQLSDGHGITAQDAQPFTVLTTSSPTVPGGTGVAPPSGTISPENPGDTSNQPETVKPNPPREGAYELRDPGVLMKFLQSPETPLRVAQVSFGLLAAIALIVLYYVYREWRNAQIIAAILRRNQETLEHKNMFLQLAAHHLRTPLSLLTMSTDVLATSNSAIAATQLPSFKALIERIRLRAEGIIASTSESQEIQLVNRLEEEPASKRALAAPLFWLPLTVVVVVVIATNMLVMFYAGRAIQTATAFNQLAFIILGALLLYVVVRLLFLRKNQRAVLERSRQKVVALETAKVEFARRVGRELAEDATLLAEKAGQLKTLEGSPVYGAFQEGVQRITNLVQRFQVVEGIYSSPRQYETFELTAIVNDVLGAVGAPASAKFSDTQGRSIVLKNKDKRLVRQLVQNIITNMAQVNGAESVEVRSGMKNGQAEISITGPAGLDTPAQDVFSVYSDSDKEEAGTYSEGEMRRLDLYLDRLIADELDADIAASQDTQKTRVTIKLPA